MQTLLYIYFAGYLAVVLYECYKFSQQVKLLTSFSSFVFILLESLKGCAKGIVYPVSGVIFVLQLPFANSVLEDYNELLDKYNGYSDDGKTVDRDEED